jgi:hypothetical protein
MKMLEFESISESPLGNFKILTKDQAIQFEEHLHAVYDARIDCPGKIIFGLGNIFEVCHKFKKEYGSRVFTAVIDLAISQTNCAFELDDCVKVWNKYFPIDNEYGNTPESTILLSKSFFEGKLYFQRYLNSFVLKFRAHWDKIMGLYFLIWKYDSYKQFIRSHTKKRMFVENFEGHQMVEQEVVNYVKNKLTDFDQRFRTHEAHGTGRIRKFTFCNGLEQSRNILEDIVNEHYAKYAKLAPKIFKCIEYFLIFPETLEMLESRKQN